MGGFGGRGQGRARMACVHTSIATAWCALIPWLPAQDRELGELPVRVFTPDQFGGHHQVWGVAQDHTGLIYIANLQGVFSYDGTSWHKTPHPEERGFFSVATDHDGTVLVGCGGDFGYLAVEADGGTRFVSLCGLLPEGQREVGTVLNIVVTTDAVFFVTAQAAYRWRRGAATQGEEMRECAFPEGSRQSPHALGYVQGRVLVRVEDIGLAELDGDEFEPLPGGDYFADKWINGYIDRGDGRLILCAGSRGLLGYDGRTGGTLDLPAQAPLAQRRIRACVPFDDDTVAVSTIGGGVLMVNRAGEVLRILDRSSGLPNNAVNGPCMRDQEGGLWVPTDYGVARYQFGPIQTFGFARGIDGVIHHIARHDQALHVGTGIGLFRLQPDDEDGRMAVFERQPECNGKILGLASTGDRLLIASDHSLLELRGGRTRRLLEANAASVTTSRDGKRAFVGTWASGLYVVQLDSADVTAHRVWPSPLPILHITEDPEGTIWITQQTEQTRERLVRVDWNGTPQGSVIAVTLGADHGVPEALELRAVVWQNRLHVVADTGLFALRDGGRFEPVLRGSTFAALRQGMSNPHVDVQDRLWCQLGSGVVARLSGDPTRLEYPFASTPVRSRQAYLVEDGGQTVWTGGADGTLVRHDARHAHPVARNCTVRISSVQSSHGLDLLRGRRTARVSVPHGDRSLRFDYSALCFGPDEHRYQWRLVGLDDSWSAWSTTPFYNFTDLWEGHYRFEVRTEHAGEVPAEATAFEFQIEPPWFRSWWAYILWATAVGAVLWLAAVLRFRRTRRQIATLRAAQEALRQSELRYRTLVEVAPEAIMVFDLDAERFVEVNRHAVQLFGVDRDDLLTKTPSDLSPRLQPNGRLSSEYGAEWLERAMSGETASFTWVHLDRDGNELPCEIHLVRQPQTDRRQVRATVIDLSPRRQVENERKRLEDQLRTARKLEALGRLAGGISHDFNNILTALLGESDLLRARMGPECTTETHEHLEAISQCTERAASLTRQLLAFSRQQVMNPRVLDVNAVLSAMEPMLRRVMREDIELDIAPHDQQCCIRADSGQIEQVVVNLVANARDAMPNGGTLHIGVTRQHLDAEYVASRSEATTGPHIALTVRDSGEGISAEAMTHLFEPFFTTKPDGRGTGLGLASVHGIVRQSGGHVTVESELGSGTTFRVLLPEVDERPEPTTLIPRARPRGDETVLVCDDDRAVLRTTTYILSKHGYHVMSARGPDEALVLARTHDGVIDLLLTDVIMPGMNGRELADHLLVERPTLTTLFMSGYTADVVLSQGIAESSVELLEKPFSADALLRRVRLVLDQRASERERAKAPSP